MTGPFLELVDARKHYGGIRALDGVDFQVYSGEVQCLAGGNGSGKSTLIKIMSGVETPDAGTILRVQGRERKHWTASASVREGIEVIYQELSLFPNLVVAENIALSRWVRERRFCVGNAQMRVVAKDALGRIGVDVDPGARLSDLSLAQQQLVAVARALTADPRLLIMDEPTTALTRREIDALFRVVLGLVKEGMAVLFVSHKLDEVLEIATRVTVLRDGRKVGDYQARELDVDRLGELVAGATVQRWERREDDARRKTRLQVKELTRHGEFEGVTLEVRSGEVVGLTGLLGSGRTELALSLFGLNPADSGEVRVDGKRVRLGTVQEAMKHGMAYVPEDRSVQGLVMEHSVGWNWTVPLLDRLIGRGGLLSMRRERECIEGGLKRFGIRAGAREMPVRTLSGGNQQRVVLGKWLTTQPRVLILDCPTVGIDVGAKREIHRMIRNQAEQGMGILLISDEIPEVLAVTDRFYVMNEGRLLGEYMSAATTVGEVRALLEGDACGAGEGTGGAV